MKTTIIQPKEQHYKKVDFNSLAIGDCFIWVPLYKQDAETPFDCDGYCKGVKTSSDSWFSFDDLTSRDVAFNEFNKVFVIKPIKLTFEPVFI